MHLIYRVSVSVIYPVGNCMFKVNSGNTKARCEICSNLTVKTPGLNCRFSGVFIVNFGHISHIVLLFPLLILLTLLTLLNLNAVWILVPYRLRNFKFLGEWNFVIHTTALQFFFQKHLQHLLLKYLV